MHSFGLILFLLTLVLVLLAGRGQLLFTGKRSITLSAAAEARAGISSEQVVPLAMRVIVSLLVLGVALYVITSRKFGSDQEKWASGAVGTILGYWLKS